MNTIAPPTPPSQFATRTPPPARLTITGGPLPRLAVDDQPVSWDDVAQVRQVSPTAPGTAWVATYGAGGGSQLHQLTALGVDRAGHLVRAVVPTERDGWHVPGLSEVRAILGSLTHVVLVGQR